MKLFKRIAIFMVTVQFLLNLNLVVFAENELNLLAPSAILMEPTTGKILYEKNSHEIRACASITKVMTMTLVMEAIDEGKISLTDIISASDHAASMGGSDIWLEPGEKMSVDDLIKATLVASANDAAVALAEAVSGSEEIFVTKMNEKAKSLGMNDTTFKNCNGLDEDGHLTSAHDVAVMSRELIKHKEVFNYTLIWIDYLRNGKTQLVNTNKLLKSYNGITGLKTGTTSQAGSCVTATAKRENLTLIAVVLGGANGKDRFKDAASLLDYGFANYIMATPQVNKEALDPVKVLNGMDDFVNVEVNVCNNILVQKGKEKSISCSTECLTQVQAPVEKGQVLGTLTYKIDDQILEQYDITAQNQVKEITFNLALDSILKTLFKL